MRRRATLSLVTIVLFGLAPAAADTYPVRPITLVVPFAAGGPVDTLARILAPTFSTRLGQPVVVENVSGGGSTIGVARVARSTPDGHTLLLHNVNIAIVQSSTVDPARDFAAVGLINNNPMVLVGRKSLPALSVQELIAWSKTSTPRFAHPGTGSQSHLAAALFAKAAGANADYIPYRGGGPALQDVIAGHVDLFFATPQAAAGAIRNGTANGYGITSTLPASNLPEAPPLGNVVDPKLNMLYWHALFAPAKTPRHIIERLNSILGEVLQDPKIIAAWSGLGVQIYAPTDRTPEAAQALLVSELRRWSEVAHETKIDVRE